MKLNERYGKPNAHYMKRLEEITRYAMDDSPEYWLSEWIYYCQWIIAIKGMTQRLLPVL